MRRLGWSLAIAVAVLAAGGGFALWRWKQVGARSGPVVTLENGAADCYAPDPATVDGDACALALLRAWKDPSRWMTGTDAMNAAFERVKRTRKDAIRSATIATLDANERDRRVRAVLAADEQDGIEVGASVGAASAFVGAPREYFESFYEMGVLELLRDRAELDALRDEAIVARSGYPPFQQAVACLGGASKPLASLDDGSALGASTLVLGACSGSAKAYAVRRRASYDASSRLVPMAMMLAPPVKGSLAPAAARQELFRAAIASVDAAADQQPNDAGALRDATLPIALLPSLVGTSPSPAQLVAWALAGNGTCRQQVLQAVASGRVPLLPWDALNRGAPDTLAPSVAVFIEPDRAEALATALSAALAPLAACANKDACCARDAVRDLARAVAGDGATEAARRGDAARTLRLVTLREALGAKPVEHVGVLLAAGDADAASRRASAAIDDEPLTPHRIDVRLLRALARVRTHDLEAALADATKAREESLELAPPTGDNEAPVAATSALWLTAAISIRLGRPPPTRLARYELKPPPPDHRPGTPRPTMRPEELALAIWAFASEGGGDARHERQRIVEQARSRGDEPFFWLLLSGLANGGDADVLLDLVRAPESSRSAYSWSGGAVARAWVRALVWDLLGDTKRADEWRARQAKMSALVHDPRTAILGYYAGL